MQLLFVSDFRHALVDFDSEFSFNQFSLQRPTSDLSEVCLESIHHLVGTIPMRAFLDVPYFSGEDDLESIDQLRSVSYRLWSRMMHYSGFLWFLQDTAACCRTLISWVPETGDVWVVSGSTNYSNSRAEHIDSTFSLDELEEASEIYRITAEAQSDDEPVHRPNHTGIKTDVSSFVYRQYNKNSRIERSLSFLGMARSQPFIVMKISMYVAVLECLFTTDSGEITHKVSERAAKYIGEDGSDELHIYKIIKQGYDIRSKYLHGQPLQKGHDSPEKLATLSQSIDAILRKIMANVILKDRDIFLQGNNELNDWFNSLLFK